jgi:hypothetical protein
MHGPGALLTAIATMVAAATSHVPLDDIHFDGWSKTALSFLHRPPHFLGRDELAALPVAPPPANSSPETRAELDGLLELQAHRTRAQQQAIDAHREYANVCQAVLRAAHADGKPAPRTRALLGHVEQDASLAVFQAKMRFNRARPHQLEPRLRPCLAVPGHPAYPSGHALQGYLVARVLSLIFPEDGEALAAAGALIGHEREIAGLHYPSDARASRALGDAIFTRLETNEKFAAEVEGARAEWRPGSTRGASPASSAATER